MTNTENTDPVLRRTRRGDTLNARLLPEVTPCDPAIGFHEHTTLKAYDHSTWIPTEIHTCDTCGAEVRFQDDEVDD